LAAAAHVHNIALRDGTAIAICPDVFVLFEIFNPAMARFESKNFSWIGTISPTTDVLAVLKSSRVETIEDAKTKEVLIGATGPSASHSVDSLGLELVNALLGTKLRIVRGYKPGPSIDEAMERGEVAGRSNLWMMWKILRGNWIRDNKLSYLLQFGPKEADLPMVPSFSELVKDPEDLAMAQLLEIKNYVGRSVFAPPNIPAERLSILRNAFDATMQDTNYVTVMTKANLGLNPFPASELQTRLDVTMAKTSLVPKMKEKMGIK